MIIAGVGFSTNIDGIEAAKEAALQAVDSFGNSDVDWSVVFCTFPHRNNYKDILKTVSEITKTSEIVGCSGIGILTNKSEIEANPGVVVLAVKSDEINANTFIFHHSDDGGIQTGIKIGELFSGGENTNSLMVLFPDAYTLQPELLIAGIESRINDVRIVGASASEEPSINSTFEFYRDEVFSGSVCGMLLDGNIEFKIGVTQGCKPVGETCYITKADGNIIYEIDGEPAYDVLKRNVPKTLVENQPDLISHIFLGFSPDQNKNAIIGDEYLVRNLIGYNQEKGMIGVGDYVKEGQTLRFTLRNPQMAREDLNNMLERVRTSKDLQKSYKFGFYFNCCARGSSFYGHPGIDTAYINHVLGDIPIIGIFGNSELAPLRGRNHLFTYTGVLVLIEG